MPAFAPSSTCVILVPANGAIERECDASLRELERRGHPVWRVGGYAAVDAARNQMATDALAQGFEELMWIDSDVIFDPNDIDRLRSHNLPLTCGLYPKKGPRQFACELLPGTPGIRFGQPGGLVEIRYCGFGFTPTHKSAFAAVHQKLKLPLCNQRFGRLARLPRAAAPPGAGHRRISDLFSRPVHRVAPGLPGLDSEGRPASSDKRNRRKMTRFFATAIDTAHPARDYHTAV